MNKETKPDKRASDTMMRYYDEAIPDSDKSALIISTPKGKNWTYDLYKKHERDADFMRNLASCGYSIGEIIELIPDGNGLYEYAQHKMRSFEDSFNGKLVVDEWVAPEMQKENHCVPWSELDWEPDPERDMYLKYISLDACIVSEELSLSEFEYTVDNDYEDHKPNIVEHNKKRYICGEWKFSEREAVESSILERNKFMREIESMIEKGYRKF